MYIKMFFICDVTFKGEPGLPGENGNPGPQV